MQTYQDTGKYTAPDKSVIQYPYEYVQYSEADMSTHGASILSLANRQAKVDANNQTRAKVQVDNGHATRGPMTPEAKAKLKEAQAKQKAIRNTLKAKAESAGMSVEEFLATI